MNIKHYLSAAAALVLMAACSDYDPGQSGNVENLTDKELETLAEYDENFAARYGTPAQNHTWGFGEVGVEDAANIKVRGTRGSAPEGNLWESWGYTIPADIEDEERLAVVEAFRTYTESNIQPNLTTFFVQQVYKGGVQYELVNARLGVRDSTYIYPDHTTPNPNYVLSSNHMDHLHCASTDGTINDHIFDFNYGNSDDWGSHYGGRMLMENSSTQDFYYHNSNSNEDRHEYICLQVEWIDKNGVKKSGAYVGFDFYSNGENPNQKVDRDKKYDDWIVKIVPAEPNTHEWYRVMCEDLGNTYDFDFNDLVFDVYFTQESSQIYANVCVQAAGGTLPIYVGYDSNESYEAHKLLGMTSTSIPVNVDAGATANPSDIIKIPVSEANPDAVNIYVGKKSAEGVKTTILLPRVGSVSSITPQKICIPGNTVRWTKEHKQLGSGISSYTGAYADGAYLYFNEWVQNPDGDYGFKGATPWTTTNLNDSMLH